MSGMLEDLKSKDKVGAAVDDNEIQLPNRDEKGRKQETRQSKLTGNAILPYEIPYLPFPTNRYTPRILQTGHRGGHSII